MTMKKSSTAPSKKTPLTKNNFPIVGIGASAGGLEAINELLMNLPPDIGMAFVIVQHLDPNHESMIGEILSRKTLMPVIEIKNNMRVRAGNVYVISPNTSLKISNSILKILPRDDTKGIHLPIDTFFKSLASDQKYKSIGIVLSGTGSDGTDGLGLIKAEAGLTIAQNPKTAKYDGMSRSAIEAGVVDLVLSPKKIGEELVRFAKHPYVMEEEPLLNLLPQDLAANQVESYFGQILTLLQNKWHVDFSHYKHNTLNRRISRRMALRKKKHLKEYLEYLEKNPDEIDCLYGDILINVTEFFRDPIAFAELKTQILPEIMKNRESDSPVRIWVVGCATGEEAYSVTMSLLEFIGTSKKQPIQIFGTDISEQAIRKARAGVYPESISKNVSKKRLERFFTKTETGYRINNSIREMCLFSWHDVTGDPPYAKLDLICCRNLLIYFNQKLQDHVLPIFHYALKPKGFLMLGRSETIGKSLPSLFNIIDKKNKFYSRNPTASLHKFRLPVGVHIPEKLDIAKKFSEPTTQGVSDIAIETDHIAALKYAPPGVVVNNGMEIILIRGEIAPYLQLAHGQPSFNLFKMAHAELASDLRMLIRMAKKNNAPARKNDCILQTNEQVKTFSIDVVPFTFTPISLIKEQHFLISFEPVTSALVAAVSTNNVTKKRKQRADSQDQYIKELEQGQSDSKSKQQTMIQDFEITEGELTSLNEELQTTLEELQSTNEELETAKEELQSTNEELTTVNDELQSRNTDLTKLTDDLVNLLASVDIPIVMVGMDSCIRRFTPKAGKMFNLIRSDVGRPISDINPNFNQLDLNLLVSDVFESIALKEMNIQDREGRWFRLQIRPYMTTEGKIDGAVIALVDINLLKQDLMESESSLDYANSIANTVRLPLVVLDKQLRLRSANHAFYEQFNVRVEDEGSDLLKLINTSKELAADVRKTLTVAFVSNVELKDFEVEYKSSNSTNGTVLMNGRRIKWIGEEEPNALLLSIQDITDRLELENSLKEAISESSKANQSKDEFLATLSHELRTPLTAILCWAQLLLKMEEGSKKLKHGLVSIEQNSKIQGQLIDDLLDVSRIQSGKLSLNITELAPGNVVRSAVESVRSLATSKSIIIKPHIKLLNGYVAADPARLQQIVWNLLTNAIKFSPPKTVIDIHVKIVKKPGKQFVAIQVIDQGKGIKPEFLPQLFDRFTQADSTTTRLHGGLGLGLTIAHDLLKLLGGSIQAKSPGEGKGATFTVLLPLIPKSVKLKKKAKLKKGSKAQGVALWQKLNGLNILLVEDEQNSVDALTELLSFAGATINAVTSAELAMIALEDYQPDILISDIAMPGTDGISLIESVRSSGIKHIKQIPAIALTAYSAKEDINRALQAGFNVHVAKPFNAVDLITCVANLAVGRSK